MRNGIILGQRDSDERWDSRHIHLNSRIPAEDGNDAGVGILNVDLPDHDMPSPPTGGQTIDTTMATIRHGLGVEPYYMVYMILEDTENALSLTDRFALNFLLLGAGGSTYSYVYAKADRDNLYIKRRTHTGGTAISPDNFAGRSLRFKYIVVNTPAVGHFNSIPPGLET